MTVVYSIDTDRLRLRPCRDGDLPALHALWIHPQVRRFLWDGEVISPERAAKVIAMSEESFDRDWFGLWSLFPRDESALAGFAGLRPIEGTPEVELLYGLHPRFWGKGLATEASRAVIGYAFSLRVAPRIWARADAPNEASLGVMRRLRMKPAIGPGSDAGLVCYEISAAEFAEATVS